MTISPVLKKQLLSFCLLFFGLTIAWGEPPHSNTRLLFQVVEEQVVLDSSTVESATLISPKTTSKDYGVSLKLTAAMASKVGELTQANIGKQINILLNDKVISSPVIKGQVGEQLVISGLSKEQANKFIKRLSAA